MRFSGLGVVAGAVGGAAVWCGPLVVPRFSGMLLDVEAVTVDLTLTTVDSVPPACTGAADGPNPTSASCLLKLEFHDEDAPGV